MYSIIPYAANKPIHLENLGTVAPDLLGDTMLNEREMAIMRFQSMRIGLALGTTPGLIWLLVRAMGGMGVNQRIYLVDVVAGPILFAAIGGLLGAMAGMLFVFIRTRRGQPINMSKDHASLAGFLAGIVPGLNGLIFASVFLQCGGDDSLSGNIVGCDNLRTVYVLSSASITVAGGLLGAFAGRLWAARRGL